MKPLMQNQSDKDLCVLSLITNATDPNWDERLTIIDTMANLSAKFDLSKGIPYGWQLLKGKAARRFLAKLERQEMKWRIEQAIKAAAGGVN